MSEHESAPKRLIPWADPEVPGDLPPLFDMWMEGEADYSELSPDDQRSARLLFTSDDEPVQNLAGDEDSVRFLPGDHFTGAAREWLIPRLVLSPKFGRIHTSENERVEPPALTCFLDGEEINLWEELDEFPLGPGPDFYSRPLVTVGRDSLIDPDLVGATLYECTPWLISSWPEVHLDFIPIPTNEMGDESEYRMTNEAWAWVAEMTSEWAEMAAEHDLPITSEFLGRDFSADEMLEYVTRAAQGGKGTVSFNGTVIYTPEGKS